jgi:hypothetical protein
MKSRIYVSAKVLILNLIFVFGLQATEVKSHNVNYSLMSAPLSCKVKEATAKKFTIQSKIILNKKFIPDNISPKDLDQLIDDSIERQVKHLMGYYKNTKNNELNAALFAYRNLLNKSVVKDTTYGADITIDKYLPESRGNDSHPYLKKAQQIGFTKKNDQAIEVDYNMELMLSDCTPKGFNQKNIVTLPLDPYLSLWLEDGKFRTARSIGPFKIDHASNCSSYEITLFGTSEVNWFFWSPVNSAPESKPCLIEGPRKVITPVISKVETVTRPPKLTKDFFKNKSKLNFSAIFGEIDNSDYFTKHVHNDLKKEITGILSKCLKAVVPECLSLWNPLVSAKADKKFYEPGTQSFLVFLKYLTTLVKIDSFEFTSDKKAEKDIVLMIKGRLIDSLMPINVSVYLGRTSLDYGPPASPEYTKFTYEAFKNADSISYVGHAGLGRNMNIFDLQKIWKRDKLKDFSRSEPLWIGLYNCEGVSHFGFDLNNVFKENKIQAIETFTSGVMSGPDFPLFQLLILNKVFANEAVSISDIITNDFSSSEFLTETWMSEK